MKTMTAIKVAPLEQPLAPSAGAGLMSYFLPPIKNTIPLRNVSLSLVYELVSTDFFKVKTEQVRHNPELKPKILAYITPSGTFKKRTITALISWSGIICIDIDKCDTGIKDTLTGDTFLNPALIFVSPSGNGLKVFIAINNGTADNHLLYFNAITQYLLDTYLLVADPSGKDIPRACFLCYDPGAFFSSGSIDSEALLNILSPAAVCRDAVCRDAVNSVSTSTPIPTSAPLHNSLSVIRNSPGYLLNQLPAIHSRAVSALETNGWHDKGELWTRPGKELKEGCSAKYNIDPRDGLYKFTNFSTNGSPFKVKGYTDVQIICELEFAGQFDKCLKTLVREYLPLNR